MYRDSHKYQKAGLWTLALCTLLLIRPTLIVLLDHVPLVQLVVALGLPLQLGLQVLVALLEPLEVQFEAHRDTRFLLSRTNRWGLRQRVKPTDLGRYRSVSLREGRMSRGGRSYWLELVPDDKADIGVPEGRRRSRRFRAQNTLRLFPAVNSPEHAGLLLQVVQFGLSRPAGPTAPDHSTVPDPTDHPEQAR